MKKYKLVLSGSGTRFPAFVGAVKRLTEGGVEFSSIAGTSGGSLVGAALASGMSVSEIEKLCTDILPNASKILKPSFFNLLWNFGLSRGDRVEKIIRSVLKDKFKDLKIPFKSITVNYDKVSIERPYDVFCTELSPNFDLTTAVRASMAIPIVFQPVIINNDRYIDGGMTSNFGLDIFGADAKDVIGVYINSHSKLSNNRKNGIFGLVKYLLGLIDIFIIGSVAEHKEDAIGANVIKLHTDFDSIDFNLTKDDVLTMIKDGYDCTDRWLIKNTLS